MSLLADALQPHVTRGFFDLRGENLATFDDLLRAGGSYPSYNPVANRWEFDFRAPDTVTPFLAYECARFACASFQSYHDVQRGLADANLLPWALIKAYYSAFYAGHSILRALGISCTYVDGPRVSLLRAVLSAYGVTQMQSGLYRAEATNTGSLLKFEHLNQGQGGSHEAFWKVFAARIQQLEQDVLTGQLAPRDAQNINVILGRVRGVLTRNASDAAWLSTVRNAVQYRQEHGVWYPKCEVRGRDRTTLSRIAASWYRDPLAIDVPAKSAGVLGAFLSACAFLGASCRTLVLRIGQLGTSRSFAHYGPLRYLSTNRLLTEQAAL